MVEVFRCEHGRDCVVDSVPATPRSLMVFYGLRTPILISEELVATL